MKVQQRGLVLVVVLWVVALLAVMAGSFAYSMRTETQLAAFGVDRAKARALAAAAINYAMLHQLDPQAALRWPADGQPRDWRFGEGLARIVIQDAGGKIDLNRADRLLLRGLFAQVGGVPEEALDGLLDAVEDWRDPDNVRLLNGAEDEEYRAAGRSPPKNGPFESVLELQQVLGVTPALYRRLAPALTVYANHPGLNPAFASAAALSALPDIEPEVITDFLQLRADNLAQELPPPPLPQAGAYLSQVQGLAYHVAVTVRLDSGAAASVTAVVTRQRKPGQPYTFRAWREDS